MYVGCDGWIRASPSWPDSWVPFTCTTVSLFSCSWGSTGEDVPPCWFSTTGLCEAGGTGFVCSWFPSVWLEFVADSVAGAGFWFASPPLTTLVSLLSWLRETAGCWLVSSFLEDGAVAAEISTFSKLDLLSFDCLTNSVPIVESAEWAAITSWDWLFSDLTFWFSVDSAGLLVICTERAGLFSTYPR